jgi:hypothetical protein
MGAGRAVALALSLALPLAVNAAEVAEQDAAQALKLLRASSRKGAPQQGAEAPVIDLRAWEKGPRPGLLVGTALLGKATDKESVIWVGLFERRGAALSLVSALAVPRPQGVDPAWSDAVAVDLTAYEIAPGEQAIGVRYSNTYSQGVRSSDTEVLDLFRFTGGRQLQHVLRAVTDTEASETVEGQDEPKSLASAHEVVSLTKAVHGGFYDVALAERTSQAVRTFAWDGRRYVEQKPKPST